MSHRADSQETEPLRDGAGDEDGDGLQVLDMEKHVLSEGEPRELFTRKGASHLEAWIVTIVLSGAILVGITMVIQGGRQRAYNESALKPGDRFYEFVGEGNCKPNRPQFKGEKVSYDQCRLKCDTLAACIGFDWDSRWDVCRLRFYSNEAIIWPPPGFTPVIGVEGGRLERQLAGLSGFAGVEGSHTAGCFQKVASVPFYRFLSQPRLDSEGVAHVGPLPNVLDYYREAGLVGPLQLCQQHVQVRENGMLSYSGTQGEMILPSLDASPLLKALHKEKLESITLIVGVNADAHDGDGVGVAVEASPQINNTRLPDSEDMHVVHSDHFRYNRNFITFHPGTRDVSLRMEGPGGFDAQQLGFAPAGWSAASQLNILEITTRVNGSNKLVFKPSQDGRKSWETSWRHKLFDGRDTPTLYAFTRTSVDGRAPPPLMIGRVSLKA